MSPPAVRFFLSGTGGLSTGGKSGAERAVLSKARNMMAVGKTAGRYNSTRHYKTLFGAAEGEFSFKAKTPAELRAWQRAFRARLVEVLGLDRMAKELSGWKPKARRVKVEDCGDFLREHWTITTEPTYPLPFYILRLKGKKGALPLVLTPHGHNTPRMYAGIARDEKELAFMKEGQRDIAVQAAREGYIAIASTARGFGDTRTEKDLAQDAASSCRTQSLHALLVGRTAIGEKMWDLQRVLDWALENLDVDPARVAVTGNSSGGTQSLFGAALDKRIAVAMPSCYFCTFEASLGSIYHCECNYIPGMLRLGEMYDYAGLIAPRPVVMIAGKYDKIFPIKAVREAYKKLRHIYEVAGAPENCRLAIGPENHRYYADPAWAFARAQFGTV